MVIAKPEWFSRRKYGGWGVTPKTWQGWAYLVVAIAPFMIFQSIPIWTTQTRLIITVVWFVLLAIDIFDVMIRMKKDERETLHEALAERNALWTMMMILVVGVAYQVAQGTVLNNYSKVDWFVIAALVAGLIAKATTNIYLEHKN